MPTSFLTGSITLGGAACTNATITCPTLSLSCLDGTFIGGTSRAGSHVLTVHAPGCKPVTKKVALAKPGSKPGKPKVVDIALKPLPKTKG